MKKRRWVFTVQVELALSEDVFDPETATFQGAGSDWYGSAEEFFREELDRDSQHEVVECKVLQVRPSE